MRIQSALDDVSSSTGPGGYRSPRHGVLFESTRLQSALDYVAHDIRQALPAAVAAAAAAPSTPAGRAEEGGGTNSGACI
jgi:hypothetical protein